MATECVEITEEDAQFIRDAIDSGRFQSVSEVIRAGVRLLADQLDDEVENIEELRALIDEGDASGESDRTPAEIWAAAEAKYKVNDA